MAPIYQCCLFRFSTLEKLLTFVGPGAIPLSERMRASLLGEIVQPLILEPHIRALDRRLKKILGEVHYCITSKRGYQNVVLDDGF